MATEVIREKSAVIPSTRDRAVCSVLGGQLAGLVMAVVMMLVYALFLGQSIFFPVQVIASLLLGHDALTQATPGVIAFGVLLHQLGPSLGWSLVFFGLLMLVKERVDLNRAMMIGFLVGLASIIVDVYLIGPGLQRITAGENLWLQNVPRFWDWAAHMVYGLSLGFFFWAVRSRIESRRGTITRERIPKAAHADEHGVTRD